MRPESSLVRGVILIMALRGVSFLLLLFSVVPMLHASCPEGMYCPADANCDINSGLCKPAVCPGVTQPGSPAKDCKEGNV